MDGLEASAKIIELGAGVPIVAMTANIMSNDLEIYKQSGMSDCVGKPFTSQELWRCLLKYIKPLTGASAAGKNLKAEIPLDKDLEFKKSLQKTFLKSNKERYKEITALLDSGDIKTAYRLVHSLKGNAGQLGISSLQNAALDVEHSLRDEKNLVSSEQLSRLKNELDAALAELAIKTASSGEEPVKPAQVQPLDAQAARELLEKLEPMLMSGDPESCDLAEDLRAIEGSETLIRQIEDYEFELALVALGDLRKKLGQ